MVRSTRRLRESLLTIPTTHHRLKNTSNIETAETASGATCVVWMNEAQLPTRKVDLNSFLEPHRCQAGPSTATDVEPSTTYCYSTGRVREVYPWRGDTDDEQLASCDNPA